MTDYYVAFWNVENLFDIAGSPDRTPKLKRTLEKELKDWTQPVLDQKIFQLASIIKQMNGGLGPDLLGVAEIENKRVLELLRDALASLHRPYEIVHHDMSDERGIDVAFIYDSSKFTAGDQFMHVIVKRVATRELFQVNFTLSGANFQRTLVVVGNHWPSRLAGHYESEPFRIIAGETLAYFHERIRDELGKNTAVLVMGDFNDEPFSRSLVEHALSDQLRAKVTRSKSPKLWNLMWPLLARGLHSHYFNTGYLIDQFLVSKGLASTTAPLRVLPESVEIIMFPEMVKAGANSEPRRYGRPSKGLDQQGFSDHFPIGLKLRA